MSLVERILIPLSLPFILQINHSFCCLFLKHHSPRHLGQNLNLILDIFLPPHILTQSIALPPGLSPVSPLSLLFNQHHDRGSKPTLFFPSPILDVSFSFLNVRILGSLSSPLFESSTAGSPSLRSFPIHPPSSTGILLEPEPGALADAPSRNHIS